MFQFENQSDIESSKCWQQRSFAMKFTRKWSGRPVTYFAIITKRSSNDRHHIVICEWWSSALSWHHFWQLQLVHYMTDQWRYINPIGTYTIHSAFESATVFATEEPKRHIHDWLTMRSCRLCFNRHQTNQWKKTLKLDFSAAQLTLKLSDPLFWGNAKIPKRKIGNKRTKRQDEIKRVCFPFSILGLATYKATRCYQFSRCLVKCIALILSAEYGRHYKSIYNLYNDLINANECEHEPNSLHGICDSIKITWLMGLCIHSFNVKL